MPRSVKESVSWRNLFAGNGFRANGEYSLGGGSLRECYRRVLLRKKQSVAIGNVHRKRRHLIRVNLQLASRDGFARFE
jgi:hypothetical protein